MRIVWVILLVITISFQALSIEPVQKISRDSMQDNLNELIREYKTEKMVPDEIRANFYTAIGYYPELKNVKIKVRYGSIKTTMQCRPRWDFFLHKKENRAYVIYIDNKIVKHYGVLYEQLPLNAQIGVLGHELAHVVDYHTRSNLEIAIFGLNYLKPDKKRAIENSVDLIAIQHGLGYQINDFSQYIFEDSGASFDYLKYKMKYYFRPNQIKAIIANNPIYLNSSDLLTN